IKPNSFINQSLHFLNARQILILGKSRVAVSPSNAAYSLCKAFRGLNSLGVLQALLQKESAAWHLIASGSCPESYGPDPTSRTFCLKATALAHTAPN
ncbi:hypothetical protein, partial [uncultured Mucilaginibacter sp.]|uniref:hypothetical protein n=1 Tax=uncultured Mucilaginibacter sp. TaxID=797541 RepID=UPI0025D9E35F